MTKTLITEATGRPDIKIEGLKIDRAYVESKCQWQEQTDRSARWMGRDSVAATVARTGQ